jgi:hypothetical protein
MEEKEGVEHQQVMGLNADLLTSKALVPKFKFDGENPGKFNRDFPVVAASYGVTEVYKWPKGKVMTEEEELKNNAALLVLREYLSDKILKIVSVGQPKMASVVYGTLSRIFLTTDAKTTVHVNRELHSCEMALGESLTDFVARINDLMEESERLGEVYSGKARMIMVATRLREPWRTMANDKLDREPELEYEELIQFLVLRERGDKPEHRPDQAYLVTQQQSGRGAEQREQREQREGGRGGGRTGRGRGGRGRGRVSANICHNCGQSGHWKRFCPQNQCYRCGRRGHMSYECADNNIIQNVARMTVEETFGEVSENDQQNFAYVANELYQVLGKDVFLLDGAATTHMVESWVQLKNEQPVDLVVKGLGNMKATCKGMLCVQGITLGAALKVPGLGTNLISEGVLQSNGCEVVSKQNWRKVWCGGKLLISANFEKGLFVWRPTDKSFMQKSTAETCYLADGRSGSSLQLWHLRMGHLNVADLHILRSRSTGIKSLGNGDLQLCISCCRAKASLRSFSGNCDKSVRPLQTIYVDLWGPMKQSIEGSTYAMLVVDEYTSYTWGFYLQCKSQAADILMQFVREQDRDGRRIVTVRSDRGGEFSSAILKDFFSSMGIVHAMSPPYTPQYQGKVERMNRTVGEMAHAMRVGAGLDISFWSLAWGAAVFLRNRSPTGANRDKQTPYFMLFGKLPRLENLFVFGCKAEAYVNSLNRRKGEDRSRPGIFVGYDERSRAYKFLPSGERKWMTVRTIFCDEKKMLNSKGDDGAEGLQVVEVEADEKVQALGGEIFQQRIAEPKQQEREQLVAAKSTQMLTRSKLQQQLSNIAMVAVDDLGGEHHIPGGGIDLNVPRTIAAALNGPEAGEWKEAIDEEMKSIIEAGTLSDPVEVPEGVTVTNLKFVFVKKVGEDGTVNRFKARLVYDHRGKGDEEENTYSPVADKVSLRVFLSVVASNRWNMVQADVKTAFLNADNPGHEFVRLPKEVVLEDKQRIRILLKALYGLQRAPRMWHMTFANWAIGAGFKQSQHDPCWFMHSSKQQMIIIYVDDMIMAAGTKLLLDELVGVLTVRFKSRVLGEPSYFLGMNLCYDRKAGTVMMTQQTYIEAVIEKYQLQSTLPKSLPLAPGIMLVKDQGEEMQQPDMYGSLVGALLFLAVCTRPDISFAVGLLSRFVSKPSMEHWGVAVKVVAYLKSTKEKGIMLGGDEKGGQIVGYADSDWGSDTEDRISVSGGVVYWGPSILSWFSRKQSMISLSTAEAESHALVDVAKGIVYIQRLVQEVHEFLEKGDVKLALICTDNQPAIDAVLNGKGRTKHYDLRIKYLAEGIARGWFDIGWVSTVDNIADIFTKALRTTRFRMLAAALVRGESGSKSDMANFSDKI